MRLLVRWVDYSFGFVVSVVRLGKALGELGKRSWARLTTTATGTTVAGAAVGGDSATLGARLVTPIAGTKAETRLRELG